MRAIIISSMDEQPQNPIPGVNNNPPSTTTGAPLFSPPAGTTVNTPQSDTSTNNTDNNQSSSLTTTTTGSNLFTAQTATTNQDNEVIVSGGNDNKPKVSRKFIVAIIIAVVLLVSGSVAAVVFLNNNPNAPLASINKDDLANLSSAFNDYALYLVGSEDAYQNNYDINTKYAMNLILQSDSEAEQQQFFDNAINKFNDLMDAYDKMKLTESDFGNLLSNNLDNLVFLKLYVNTTIPTGEQINNIATSDSLEEARNYVKNNYAEMLNSSSETAVNFANLAISFGETVISDNTEEASGKLTNYLYDMNSIVNSTSSSVLNDCWQLNTYINNMKGGQ